MLLDDQTQRILAKAKSLTTRPDLSLGIGGAIDAVLAQAPDIAPSEIALVSVSTTLATNALVEGQGDRAALVLIGFDAAVSRRDNLAEALGDAPLIELAGGHSHSGAEGRAVRPRSAETRARWPAAGYRRSRRGRAIRHAQTRPMKSPRARRSAPIAACPSPAHTNSAPG